MPSGVFKPYAGVSTGILIFTKTGHGGTDKVWFYDMTADGFSLDDKRTEVKDNDIPVCMATGAPISNVNFYREQFGIDRWFGDGKLLYADGSFPGKPAPDIYVMAAKQLGLDPSECVVFEDGTSGIIAAREAGCGGVVAVYDERFELPDSTKSMVDSIHHDLTDWRSILASYGI